MSKLTLTVPQLRFAVSIIISRLTPFPGSKLHCCIEKCSGTIRWWDKVTIFYLMYVSRNKKSNEAYLPIPIHNASVLCNGSRRPRKRQSLTGEQAHS